MLILNNYFTYFFLRCVVEDRNMMLQTNVKDREKKYLEELINPLNIKYNNIQIEFKEIKKDFKETKKQIKHYFITTIGISLTLTGLILGTYLSTNSRIDNLYSLILEQNNNFNTKFGKQQEFNYNLLNKVNDNQISIQQLYNLNK